MSGLALAGLLASALSTGCGSRADHAVRHRTAHAMHCPKEHTVAVREGRRVWRVQGCGMTGLFRCGKAPYVGFRCVALEHPHPVMVTTGHAVPVVASHAAAEPVEAPPPVYVQPQAEAGALATTAAPGNHAQPPIAQTWSNAAIQRIYASARQAILACVQTRSLELTITLQVDGLISLVGGAEALAPPQRSCIESVFQQVRIQGDALSPRTFQLVFRGPA